jgi:hypothetical protein
MTYWEKPSFDQFQQPIPVHATISDEYEEEELTLRRNYVILGDQYTDSILAEQRDDQKIVEGQKYSPQYYENLKRKFSVEPPLSKKWKYYWQGPGNRCWCHNKLDRPDNVYELCKKEYEHLQLLSNVPEEEAITVKATQLTPLQQQQITILLKQNDGLFAALTTDLPTIEENWIKIRM